MTYEPRSLNDDLKKPPASRSIGSTNNPTIIFHSGHGSSAPQGTCSTCRHWLAEGSLCRRFPPTPLHDGEPPKPFYCVFPETKADDTCGEYSPAGNPQIERRG